MGSGTYNGSIVDKGVAIAYGATAISYDQNGVLSLTKVSDGTLTLGGTVGYTGLTDVQGGTLAFTGTSAVALGNITMAAGTRMSTAGALNVTTGSSLTLDISSAITAGGAFGPGPSP